MVVGGGKGEGVRVVWKKGLESGGRGGIEGNDGNADCDNR